MPKILKALAFVLWLLAPIHKAMATALALVFVDLVLGLIAARRRGEKITSWGLRRTVAKLIAYEGAIVLAFAVETCLTGPVIPLSHVVGGFVGMTELTSCYENLKALTGVDLQGAVAKIHTLGASRSETSPDGPQTS